LIIALIDHALTVVVVTCCCCCCCCCCCRCRLNSVRLNLNGPWTNCSVKSTNLKVKNYFVLPRN